MTASTIILLFGAGFAGGFVDAIAGGGGMISLPALLWAGLPPQFAFGTNKLQACTGSVMAVIRYAKAGLIDWPELRLVIAVTFVFAVLGSWTVSQVSNDWLMRVVPWLLLALVAYLLFGPKIGEARRQARVGPQGFALGAGSTLGFYDGFFGPGCGSFWTLALVSLRGKELLSATAFTKVVNLTSNLGALVIFGLYGTVNLPMAACMMGGQLIGGRLGASLALQHGAGFVRAVFIVVVIAMTLRLLAAQC
jgi:uncharacterized protein